MSDYLQRLPEPSKTAEGNLVAFAHIVDVLCLRFERHRRGGEELVDVAQSTLQRRILEDADEHRRWHCAAVERVCVLRSRMFFYFYD